jgi:hypothetical protein
MTWIGITAGTPQTRVAIRFPMDGEGVQMHVTPGQDDGEDLVEVRQCGFVGDQETSPNRGTDPAQHATPLVGTGRYQRGVHVGSGPQETLALNSTAA